MGQLSNRVTLPIALTSFVGRTRELADVAQLLATARLVSLVGPGGCGKTRLALRVANEIAGQFADGVCWVELARLSDPALVIQTVAKALDVAEMPDTPLLEALLHKLDDKQMLLVLDNCEHLLAACAQLAEALMRGASATGLATSREPLGVEGEMLYPVPPLALPAARLPVVEAGQFDAIRLFIERARSVRPEFALTQDNATAIIEICRHLDGIPLAIELASARVGVLSLQQIAERLDRRLDLLTSSAHADERHRTLRATIDWSYDLLSPTERRLLQRLSVFASGFTLTTAESTCGWGEIQRADALDVLSSLVGKSLVAAETLQGSEARYRLRETIRQYAQEKLVTAGEWAETHDHFLDCYVRIAEEVAPKLHVQYQQAWFNWLEAEHDNVRAALVWALERSRIEAGLRIAVALFQFWLTRGYVHEGFAWFERLHRLADRAVETHDEIPFVVRVNALIFGTFLADFVGDVSAATAWSRNAVAMCEAQGEEGKPLLGLAWGAAIAAASVAGDYETAYAIGERAIGLERASGDHLRFGMALLTQGDRATMLGKYEAARAYLDQAIDVARQDGDSYRIAHVQNARGNLARRELDFAQAASFYEQSLSMLHDLGAARDISNTQRHLAYVYLRQGDAQRAHDLFKQSLEMQRAQDNRASSLRGLLGMAALAAATGLAEASARLHGFALHALAGMKAAQDTGDIADELDCEGYVAAARAQLGHAESEAAHAQARAWSLEQATEFALNLSLPVPVTLQEDPGASNELTAREREIVALIARGLSNGEIADKLVLSKRTVEKHVANILSKLGLTNRAHIVRWAVDHGLTE